MRSRAAPHARHASRMGAVALAATLALVLGGGPGVPAAAGGLAPASASRWSWPLPRPHPIVRGYLAPPTPYGAGHRGIDIGATAASPVLSPADGVVHFAGFVVDRPVISIEHAGGLLSSFEPVTTSLHAGEVVHRGEVIGTLLAGHCAGPPCLHLGARVDGEYVNPLVFLGGVPHAVLYPTRDG
jgi:murein DD-endopeptidase MepM/ murein hydrolase activator NlpD